MIEFGGSGGHVGVPLCGDTCTGRRTYLSSTKCMVAHIGVRPLTPLRVCLFTAMKNQPFTPVLLPAIMRSI